MTVTKRSVPTFEAKIYVGCRVAYSQEMDYTKSLALIRETCREAVSVGWCVTLQFIEYIYTPTYTTGQAKPVDYEVGFVIGAINYPRFPVAPDTLRNQCIDLASKLMEKLQQQRVTVVFTDETVMLERVQPVN